MDNWRDEDVLVTVRAYPEPSKKYGKTSCVAGVTRDGELRRLHPIPYRMLDQADKFRKYDVVRLRVRKSDNVRPESHRVDLDRPFPLISRLGTTDGWRERDRWVAPFRAPSLEALTVRDVRTSRSLALVRPRHVDRLRIEPTGKVEWGEREKAKLGQEPMLVSKPAAPLEKIPYKFSYEFHCEDARCNGHCMSIVDWEIHQSYRKWLRQYGDDWEEKFRQQYANQLLSNDLQFFVGTLASRPQTWLIIGLYYPPKMSEEISQVVNLQPPLFA